MPSELPDETRVADKAVPSAADPTVREVQAEVIRAQVRILELEDAVADRETEGNATRQLLTEAQRELDLALSEVRSLTRQRDDVAAQIPHIRHQQHLAARACEEAHQELGRKSDEIARLNAELGALREALRRAGEMLTAERAAHHEAQQRLVAFSNEITAQRELIVRLQSEAAALRAEVGQWQAEAARLAQLATALERERDDLRGELGRTRDLLLARETKILAMQDSFSWKVTMPLRWLRRQLKRER